MSRKTYAGLRIGSLFAGIGGLELGLEWAGVGHTVWQVEIDPFCRDVLAKHWPDAKRFDDVRTVGTHNLEAVDVICGGYPCQPFSIAGKQLGEDDPRHLWPEFARLLGELRPRYAVLENVPAHLGLGFGTVLGDLADLGYDAEWQVLSAREVGAPHLRQRVFVLAYASGQRVAGHCESVDARQDGIAPEMGERWTRGPRNMRELCDDPFVGRNGVPQPLIRVVDDGLSRESLRGRIKSVGNAVVPQVAEVVGRRLLEIHNAKP